jgi:alpha-glucosidase
LDTWISTGSEKKWVSLSSNLCNMNKRCWNFVFACFIALLVPFFVVAQVTIRVTALPTTTPADPILYFAASINDWNPGDPAYRFVSEGNGVYRLTIPEATGTVLYKITRGNWATVESAATGQDISNRSFTFNGSPQTLQISVLGWKDLTGSTAASNVTILNNAFYMPQLNRTRKVWIYLPPDYSITEKRYPVVYMQDGQNLFDAKTSFSGEWEVDETLNRLHVNGDYGAIVVGIDNGGSLRINEYSPWVHPQYGGGEGAAYIDFIAQTLKPYIDANYRTLTNASNTCLFGSSMGALIASYGAAKYPGVFGKVGAFSPAYWFAQSELNQMILNSAGDYLQLRLYHVGGQNESATMITNMQSITSSWLSKGLANANSFLKADADGAHSEWYWRREFGAAYQWLFNRSTSSPVPVYERKSSIRIVPNPVSGMFQLAGYTYKRGDVVSVSSATGLCIKKWIGPSVGGYYVGDIPPALYFVLLNGRVSGSFICQ